MSATPAVFLGDFTVERTVLLAIVPRDEPDGAQVRALHVLVGEDLAPDPQNYWLLQIGRLDTGAFNLLAPETSFAGGFASDVAKEIAYDALPSLARGDKLAARLSPRGSPPPLTGLSVAVEWGALSPRRS